MPLAASRALIHERSAGHALEAYASYLGYIEDGHRHQRLEHARSLCPTLSGPGRMAASTAD